MTASFAQVAPGVIAVAHDFVDGRCGLVFGRRAALVVDTPFKPEEVDLVVRRLSDDGPGGLLLAYTHGHYDHVAGSGPFRDAHVLAHRGTEAVMRLDIRRWSSRLKADPRLLSNEVAWPTITTDSRLEVDLGGSRVCMLPTPGHTSDSMCVHLPEHGVLFGGDTVVTGILPTFTDGDSAQLVASLQALKDLDVRVLVGGHGPVVQGASAVRAVLTASADYLFRVREHVATLAGRLPEEEVVTRARYEDFVGDRFDPGTHGMVRRHERAVRDVYREVTREVTATRNAH